MKQRRLHQLIMTTMRTKRSNRMERPKPRRIGGALMKKVLSRVFLYGTVAVLGGVGFAYSGMFNVAADDPHSSLVSAYLDIVRSRSIAVRARNVDIPDLDNPDLIRTGAEHYEAMCSGCHLSPAKQETEIRSGLYPRPPNLSEHAHGDPKEMFWIIKHGIKMSGMPAWGTTHDDESIWAIVAFLGTLPNLSAEEYEKVARAIPDGKHPHSSGTAHQHNHTSSHSEAAGKPLAEGGPARHSHQD